MVSVVGRNPFVLVSPQGSVLGPTLFLIYINDLCNFSLPNCKIITYADDTALLIHGQNWQVARNYAENALKSVMCWLRSNLLTLNISKTKFMAFSPTTASQPPSAFSVFAHVCSRDTIPLPVTCHCPLIERTSTYKYLGVMIDSTLSWKHQIDTTVSRVRKLIFVFKTLRPVIGFESLKIIYYALAQSVLSYCIVSWGGCVKTQMLRLERAQRAVLKVLLNKPIWFPTSELYSLTQLPTVRQLFILQTISRKHSILVYDPDISNSKRRSDKVCKTEHRRTALASRHFYFLSSMLYNKVNKEINIYPLTKYSCKHKCQQWLIALSYEETENLLKITS